MIPLPDSQNIAEQIAHEVKARAAERASDLWRVHAGGLIMTRLISAGTSFLSQEPAEAFFGIGVARAADSVTIEWPGGGATTWHDLAGNHSYVLEPGGAVSPEHRLHVREPLSLGLGRDVSECFFRDVLRVDDAAVRFPYR